MDFFIKPKNMMKNIHCRTHFKAAISLSRGDPCCLKILEHEFNDQFMEISHNMENVNRSMNDWHPARNSITQGGFSIPNLD